MGKKITFFVILLIFGLSPIFAEPCGDVNSSGGIDIVDALMIAQYYVGLNPQPFDMAAAEVSGDSLVNIVDALQIAQYYVGLITSFLGCKPTPTVTPPGPTSPPMNEMIGWAAMPGKGLDTTTGGGNASPVVVTSASQLTSLLEGSTPRVIHIQGSLKYSRRMLTVGSNKTIIGLGSDAEVVGAGFALNKVSNVIIRNITFRDTHLCGNWDGKDNGTDGFRSDTSHHIWIDHCTFMRAQDGQLDIRVDSDFLTFSWNIFADHNKNIGIGWTSNVISKMTFHHNWFRNAFQRNPSIDNVAKAHLFNNLWENIGLYGPSNRGDSNVVFENNYFRYVNDPLLKFESGSETVESGNIFDHVTGLLDDGGTAFNPRDDYAYTLDPAENVPALVNQYAGPVGKIWPQAPSTITVDIHGSGDYCLLFHAIGSIPPNQQEHVTIIVKSGTYQEVPRLWPGLDNVTIRGATGNASDVVITNYEGTEDEKFYGGKFGIDAGPTFTVYSNNVTLKDMTFENTGSGPVALRTLGENIVLDNVTIKGTHITY